MSIFQPQVQTQQKMHMNNDEAIKFILYLISRDSYDYYKRIVMGRVVFAFKTF